MSYKKLFPLLIFLIAVLIPGAGISQSEKQAPAKTSEGQTQKAGEPDRDFRKARQNFLKKDLMASAAEIRKGAAYLKSQADLAVEEGKQALTASANELEKLADKVGKGTVKSVKELDGAFARAHHALAKSHYLKTSESFARKEASKAGKELKAAGNHLERGLIRAGGKITTGAKSAIKESRSLAGKLIKGAGWANAEVERGVKNLGVEIEKLGEKVSPEKK